LQSVSDQELERAVEADVRQRWTLRIATLEQRWAEAEEAKIGFVGAGSGQSANPAVIGEERVEIAG